ncbi:MAG: outer membrane beta-barrel protein [Bdellovibrionota bacterium]
MKSFKSTFIKTSLVAVVGILSASPAHALVGFSLKAGTNLNSFSGSNSSGNSIANYSNVGMGYMGGLGVDIGVGPIGVLVDVLYAARAYKFGIGADVSLINHTLKLPSIYIPIQARFSIIPLLSLTGGVYYSMLLSDSGNVYDSSGTKTGTVDMSGHKNDFGAVAGLGVNLPLGVTTLSLEARYNYGFTNLAANPTGDESMKNRAIDVLVGMTF